MIGNNVLIGGDGMDSMISHDGSDLILADEADLSFLGLYSTGEKLEFINELNNIWRADDDSAETRLDEMLALLNTESGYAHSSLNDYLTDDGDVDTVRIAHLLHIEPASTERRFRVASMASRGNKDAVSCRPSASSGPRPSSCRRAR